MTVSHLPKGWAELSLSDIGEWLGGGTPSKAEPTFWDGTIPWVSPKDMKVTSIVDTEDHISEAAIERSAVKMIPQGSILFVTRSGILAHSFPVATTKSIVTINQDLKAIVPLRCVESEYLAWSLRATAREILNRCTKHGTTVHSIEIPALKTWRIWVPPLNEQHRIVAKIETLFSELDKGIEALKTARDQLKVYRQAVLKHAFEGKLTARWREENKDKLETPEQLLVRIQSEREAHYKQQLEAWMAWEINSEGRKPAKPKPPLKQKTQIDVDFEVPDSWGILELQALALESVLGKMLDKQKNTGTERPYLGNINVRWGAFNLSDLKSMRIEDTEVDRYSVKHGDLVVCEGGEPGRCAVWEKGDDTIFIQKALHRVRFSESYSPKFAYYYLVYSAPLERVVKNFTGTTIKHLTGAGLNKIQFPVCSLNEQAEVVNILDAQFSEIEALEKELADQLAKSETLRQSILKKAFSGQLVPQDPNDEPSSALLERIRAEKARPGCTTKGNKRKQSA